MTVHEINRHVLISIHAPARGATTLVLRDSNAITISIHAPARGATRDVRRELVVERYFNPRSREGSDARCKRRLTRDRKFQSTLPRGERRCEDHVNLMINEFQSTLPRGERQCNIAVVELDFYFNPRSREGSDLHLVLVPAIFEISIHAPARGATRARWSIPTARLFQSTLPRGERLCSTPRTCRA